jgi:hypothetical protein
MLVQGQGQSGKSRSGRAGLVRRDVIAGVIALAAASAPQLDAQANSRLVLQIHSVKCIDESNGKYVERVGGDEIVVSGVMVDAAGHAARAATLRAGYFKHDGSTKQYAPAKEFHTFKLTDGPEYPRTFRAMFVVVERDEGGGFQQVVNAMVAKLNSEQASAPNGGSGGEAVDQIMTGLTALAIGTGNVPAAVAEVVGAEAAKRIGKKMKDDIFPPALAEIRLKTPTSLFGGNSRTTAIKTVRTKAHGGRYEIKYSWRVE